MNLLAEKMKAGNCLKNLKIMKRSTLALMLFIFTISLFTNKAIAKEKKNERTQIFTVSMDCQSCVNKIKGNISYEKGVKDLNVSLDKKECTITFRTDKTSIETLIEAFGKLGYKAEIKKEKIEHKQQNNEHNVIDHEGHNHIMAH